MTRRVLFVAYGGGHVQLVLPVIQSMAAQADVTPLLLALTTAGPMAAAAGVRHIGFRDLVQPGDKSALALGERLAHEAGMTDGVVPIDETRAYLGLSFADLVARIGRPAAEAEYKRRGRAAFLPVGVLRRLIDRWQPHLVVATNSPRAERAAIEAAGFTGTPSVCIGDLFLTTEAEWIARSGYGSRVFVMADYVKSMLESRGRPSEDIVVTGNPAFDTVADPRFVRQGEEFRSLLGWAHEHVILWAMAGARRTQRGRALQDPDAIHRELTAATANRPDVRILVRPHPNFRPEVVERALLDGSGRFALSPPEQPPHAALHACDVVLTEVSTLGLEGALAGRRVVTIGAEHDPPYGALGISFDLPSTEGLQEAVTSAPPPDLRALGVPPAGTATRTVVRELMRLLP